MDPVTAVLKDQCDGPVLVHSDIRGLLTHLNIDVRKAIREMDQSDELMDQMVALLQRTVGNRDLWIPTYNYDFCKTGIYDVQNDPAQIGALPEFFRQKRAQWRTDTPVFSNSGYGSMPDSIPGEIIDPFGAESEFHQLVQQNGILLFFGVPFSPTHTHYVERLATDEGPLYRYDKHFKGVIYYATAKRPVTLNYHVIPRGITIKYDMPRLQDELLDAGVMRPLPDEYGHSYVAAAAELTNFWTEHIHKDPFYLLDMSVSHQAESLVEEKGTRLSINDFDDQHFDGTDL